MKLLSNAQNNELSFVKAPMMENISFTISLTKIVGSREYVFDNLYDKFEFDSAKDFVVFDLDLTSQDIVGGEYKLELYDEFRVYGRYICSVVDYTFEQSDSTNDLFSSTVRVSNL
jgi:hypothetical protein